MTYRDYIPTEPGVLCLGYKAETSGNRMQSWHDYNEEICKTWRHLHSKELCWAARLRHHRLRHDRLRRHRLSHHHGCCTLRYLRSSTGALRFFMIFPTNRSFRTFQNIQTTAWTCCTTVVLFSCALQRLSLKVWLLRMSKHIWRLVPQPPKTFQSKSSWGCNMMQHKLTLDRFRFIGFMILWCFMWLWGFSNSQV